MKIEFVFWKRHCLQQLTAAHQNNGSAAGLCTRRWRWSNAWKLARGSRGLVQLGGGSREDRCKSFHRAGSLVSSIGNTCLFRWPRIAVYYTFTIFCLYIFPTRRYSFRIEWTPTIPEIDAARNTPLPNVAHANRALPNSARNTRVQVYAITGTFISMPIWWPVLFQLLEF